MNSSSSWRTPEMRWAIDDDSRGQLPFGAPDIDEVLYDFDGPRIFTSLSGGLRSLWYESAVDRVATRYLVVPTDVRLIGLLKEGARTVHDALSQSWLWAVDIHHDDDRVEGWVLSGLDQVPVRSKPVPRTPLWPHLEPLIAYRLVGEGFSEGHVPASVVTRALQRPIAALKRLLELEVDAVPQGGRPEETFRKAYDLPTQRMAFNSFEVSFAVPREAELPVMPGGLTIYQSAGQRLSRAAAWLETPEGVPQPSIDMLRVLKELTPPGHGQVTGAILSGQLLPTVTGPLTLSREDRRVVTHAIREHLALEQGLESLTGRIGEFDIDNLTLTIRDAPQGGEVRCSFLEDAYDELFEAFTSETPVEVVGRLSPNRRSMEIVALGAVRPAVLVGPLDAG